ncbi:MAG: lamin tail domain-containing protein [Patescibacteria group bacterium]
MFLKSINTFLFLIVCFLPNVLLAEVVINEIMYDLPGTDQGREWIEIYNSNSLAVSLEGFNLETSSNHRPFISVSGSFILPPGGLALIVQNYDEFKKDHPNFPGIIFQSNFSLNNTTGKIILKIKDTVVDQIKYNSSLGAKGNGESLQKFTNEILASKPTPGQINQLSEGQTTQSSDKSILGGSSKIILEAKEETIKNTDLKKELVSKTNTEEIEEVKIAEVTAVDGSILVENKGVEASLMKWFGMLVGLLVVSILPIIFSPRQKDDNAIKIILEE